MTDPRPPTNSAPVSSTLVAAPQQACPECHGTTGHTLDCARVSKSQQKRYAAMAPQQEQAAPDTSELYYAHMEADRKDAEDAYFAVRPQLETIMSRELFKAGYERAYKKLWDARAIAAALNASPPKETT